MRVCVCVGGGGGGGLGVWGDWGGQASLHGLDLKRG